jgi:preprotein translocase subunit YajC
LCRGPAGRIRRAACFVAYRVPQDRGDRSRLSSQAVDGPKNQGFFAVNTMLTTLAILFAQADSGSGSVGSGAANSGGGGSFLMIEMFVVVAAFWYFIIFMPSKRERTRQATMWASIKKNDRVRTTSGILGVVTNVNKESNPPEVTLRIDESTNAKLRVLLVSVAEILGDEPSADTPSK